VARWGRRLGIALTILAVLLAGAITATIGWRPILGPKARPLTDRRFETTPERLVRGKYLVESVTGCLFCHSEIDWQVPGFAPKAEVRAGGRTWADEGYPFVTGSNISVDPETGGGTWSDDTYARAIREGIGHDGRALFPIMPYPNYRHMSDEDLAAVIVYIRSLPAVRNPLPPTRLPFPVNRFVNNAPQPLDAPVPPPPSDTLSRGKYLVTLGSCFDCHTPMDDHGQRIPGLEFAGGEVLTNPHGRVASANITQDASGIPYYDEAVFIEMMRTGHVKARKLNDQMPWNLYRTQTDDDLKAMFAYVKTLTPVHHEVDNSLPPTQCARCGKPHGAGDRNKQLDKQS
jgi:mono/diheme cytochrome c family protein